MVKIKFSPEIGKNPKQHDYHAEITEHYASHLNVCILEV